MAGHSKYNNIKHRKGAQDKKRGKVFNKLAKEITIAAKGGMPDPDHNSALRNAITTARRSSMPNDRIKRAIEIATSTGSDSVNYEAVRYEGYGSGGVAVIVEALTDNRNRTAGEVRLAFTKNGGSLGESNSVSFMFKKIGSIVYPISVSSEDDIFEKAVDAGAENVETVDETYEITTELSKFFTVKESLEKKIGEAESGSLIWKPNNTVDVDEEQARKLFNLIDMLEDSDDVQNVFANFDVSDEIMAELTAA